MKTVTIEIPEFTYDEAQRIADRMNQTLPELVRVNAAGVIAAAVSELARLWPERDIERVVPRDCASAEQLEREGRN